MSETTVAAISIPQDFAGETLRLAELAVHEGQAVDTGQVVARLERQKDANQFLELSSPSSGYIVGLHAATGQHVTAGEVLCYVCERPSLLAQTDLPSSTPNPGEFDTSSVILFGGGGHARILIDLIRAARVYSIAGIIDDGLPAGSQIMSVPVLGGTKDLQAWRSRGIALAVNGVGGIGKVDLRRKLFEMLSQAGFAFPTLIHPTAVIERSAIIDSGAQILALAYVGGNVRVGFGAILNAGALVSHDSVIGRCASLSPGATLAGNVRVEDQAQIGMRATVNLNLTIGAGAMLGNGCTVKADVPPGTRVRAGTIWPIPAPKTAA